MKTLQLKLNERDHERLIAVARHRNMKPEDCAVGLIQQSARSWEKVIHRVTSKAAPLTEIGPDSF